MKSDKERTTSSGKSSGSPARGSAEPAPTIMGRRGKTATATGIYLVLVTAILVVANLFSYSNFYRFDATAQKRFSLTLGSQRMVCELSKDLQVDFYVTRGLAKTDLFIEDVTQLFDEYVNAKCKKGDDGQPRASKFKYTIIEPKTEDEKKAAKEEGLKENPLRERSETGDTQKSVGDAYLGFVIKYGSEKEVIPFWPPESTQGLEFFISNKIREVRDRAENRKNRYGIITGKDEIKISESLVPSGLGQPMSIKNVFDEYFPYYELEEVDLKDGDTQIDQSLIGIIITQPKKDYTDKELRRIDEFLMTGDKALVVFASAVNLAPNDKEMKATLNTHGLDKLLAGYGIEMKREAAIDFGSAFQVEYPTRMGERIAFVNPAVPILEDDDSLDENEKLIDVAFPTFFRMPQIPFPFPSPLVLHNKDVQPEAEFKVVARTSPRTSIYASDTIPMRHTADWQETDPQAQQIVGVSAIGALKSAFAGKGDDMGIKANAQTSKEHPARLLVLSSSQYLSNPFARSGNAPPLPPQLQMMAGQQAGDQELTMYMGQPYLQANFIALITSFKSTLDWMANDADLVAVNAKLLSEPNLNYSMKKPRAAKGDTADDMKKKFEAFKQERKNLQSTIQWWLIIMPAALIFAYGIVRWLLREANRDKLSV